MIENLFNICLERQASEENRKMIIQLIKRIPKLNLRMTGPTAPARGGRHTDYCL